MTRADVDFYRATVDDLTTLAVRDVNSLLASLSESDPDKLRNLLVATMADVVSPYVVAAGEFAATWYEDLRADAVGGTYYATSATDVNEQQLRATARWAVRPLNGESESTVLSLLGGGVQRLIASAGRNTISTNVMQDRIRVGYARIPRSGCCAFCGMLASRGAVYNSEESATGVVGRGVDAAATAGRSGGQGKGVKARGTRALGSDRYHDFCRCVAAPVFVGDTYAGEIAQKYRNQYQQVVETSLSEYSKKDPSNVLIDSVDTKKTLAAWRQEFGVS